MTDALILLLVANGMPVLVHRLLTHHLGYPIDGRRVAPDGNPWLGSSKTVVGVVSAVIATSVVAQILGRGWVLGAGFAALAMAGDLATSFVKRRLGLPRSSHRPGLDHPLHQCRGDLTRNRRHASARSIGSSGDGKAVYRRN